MLTEQQKEYISAHSDKESIVKMTKELGLSYNAIYGYIRKKNLSIVPSGYHKGKTIIVMKTKDSFDFEQCSKWWSRIDIDK